MFLERTAGASKHVFEFHEGISQWFTFVDVNRIWWENGYIDFIAHVLYILTFI
jgi:hypothetical protein